MNRFDQLQMIQNYLMMFPPLEDLSSSSSSSSSSSDSSSSDEEALDPYRPPRRVRAKINNYMLIVRLYDDKDFRSHFRLSRTSVQSILDVLKVDRLQLPDSKASIPLEKCLLITLWILSNQESLRGVGDRFGVSKSCAHSILIAVCQQLCNHVNEWLWWPRPGFERQKCVDDFQQLREGSSFPGTFGCLDGSHIAIPGPLGDNSYYNRKGFHSLLLQGICNANGEYIDVFCGWPGSSHDSNMWKQSPIYEALNTNPLDLLPPNTHILCDSAYPLRTFSLVPFKNDGHLTVDQIRYNKILSKTRVVIEQTFGFSKTLFRRLKFLHIYNLSYGKWLITASCILHNVRKRERDPSDYFSSSSDEDDDANDDRNSSTSDDEDLQPETEENYDEYFNEWADRTVTADRALAVVKRDEIVALLAARPRH